VVQVLCLRLVGIVAFEYDMVAANSVEKRLGKLLICFFTKKALCPSIPLRLMFRIMLKLKRRIEYFKIDQLHGPINQINRLTHGNNIRWDEISSISVNYELVEAFLNDVRLC